MNKSLTLALITALGLSTAQAEKPTPLPAPSAAECAVPDRAALPIACWPGQKIRILSIEYATSFGKTAEGAMPPSDDIQAKDYIGKAGVIQRVLTVGTSDPILEIRLDNSKELIYAETMLGRREDIAFVKDYESARKNILGKSFWLKNNGISLLNKKDSKGYSVYKNLQRFTKITVVDIAYSDEKNAPLRVIVKLPDGTLGYDDISWGATNVLIDPFNGRKFENDFLDKSPKEVFHFTDKQWDAIYKNQIILGMDAQAAILAWNREPDEILKAKNKDNLPTMGNIPVDEMWVYWQSNDTKQFVYFRNGKVAYIEKATQQQ